MKGRVLRLAAAERSDLADFLASLWVDEWRAETLCEGWSVRDVVAHLISYDELDLGDLARHIVRGRLDSRRINAATMALFAGCEPAELLALLASHREPGGLMSLVGGRIALLEAVVHHQDIRRALGRPRTVPPERLIVALRSSLLAPDVGSFWRVRNVRLVATDLDFTWGFGPEVHGTGEALLMNVAGRREALTELTRHRRPHHPRTLQWRPLRLRTRLRNQNHGRPTIGRCSSANRHLPRGRRQPEDGDAHL